MDGRCSTGSKTKKRFYTTDKPETQPLISLNDRVQRIPTNIFVGFNPVCLYLLFVYPRNLGCSHDSATTEQEWMMSTLKVNANELYVALQFTLDKRNTSEILAITLVKLKTLENPSF